MAAPFAGFHDWKNKFGRNVKKGEKGIKILAPCVFEAVKEQEEPDPLSGQPMKEHRRVSAKRFKVVTVFDYLSGRPRLGFSGFLGCWGGSGVKNSHTSASRL